MTDLDLDEGERLMRETGTGIRAIVWGVNNAPALIAEVRRLRALVAELTADTNAPATTKAAGASDAGEG